MTIDQAAFNQIAAALGRHFESLYYVEIDTGEFIQFLPSRSHDGIEFPDQGKDFFALASGNAIKYIHPSDQDLIARFYDRTKIRELLFSNDSVSAICRGLYNGIIRHFRHIIVRCDDDKHIICCLEDIDDEIKEKEEQKRNLQSAEIMARRDELTGIKNRNAFKEQAAWIDKIIRNGSQPDPFGVVMCDINDLKQINDTRGHSFGDEAIQRTSRMICDVYKHSPVYRVGGDEFAVVLNDLDYDKRDELLKQLKDESDANARSRSGPTIASGMAVFETGKDDSFESVYKRADSLMYENKKEIKARRLAETSHRTDPYDTPISDGHRRRLDSLFGALYTVVGKGYVFLNDMRYDFSRWSLPLIDDFGIESEYMYCADKVWLEYIHPDDVEAYKTAVDKALREEGVVHHIHYRARRRDGSYVLLSTRGFILSDSTGEPEYFGGIMIPQV